MNFHLHKLVLFTVPFAIAAACGGVTVVHEKAAPASGDDGDASADPTTTTDPVDADVPDTNDPIDPNYPAQHTAMPLVDYNKGGRVLINPKVVTITWANDTEALVSRLQTFDDTITQSNWWTKVSSEYCGATGCIGNGVPGEHVVITDTPPASFTDSSQGKPSTMQDWIRTQVATNPNFPQPTTDTLYAIYLPKNVSVMLDDTGSCDSFGAYHNTLNLTATSDAGTASVNTAYAIIPRCDSKEGTTTLSASHEIIEAATDPDVGIGQNSISFYMQNQIWAFAGGEVGDLCVDFIGSGADHWTESTYLVQRTWSNASAKAGHNPCVPIPTGEVYFNAAPRKQQVVLKKVGDTAVIDVDAYSDAPMSDWQLSAFDFAQFQQNTTYVKASFDKTTVHNGSHAQLTLTLTKVIPRYTLVGIISKGGTNQQYYWPVAVTPN